MVLHIKGQIKHMMNPNVHINTKSNYTKCGENLPGFLVFYQPLSLTRVSQHLFVEIEQQDAMVSNHP